MFERKKYLIQENEELKEFLKVADKRFSNLESKYNNLLEENDKMRKTLTDIERAVAPLVTKTIKVDSSSIRTTTTVNKL